MYSVAIKAVLDTNVYISALFWQGAPYRVFQKGLSGIYTILISPQLMEEIFISLTKKFKFPPEDTRIYIESITADAEIVVPTIRLRVVKRDPTDNKIIECAVAGEANYIVTGDKDLLTLKHYRDIEIIKPEQFLKYL